MKQLKVALMGLGTVGRSVSEILHKEHQLILQRTGIDIKIQRIFDRSFELKKQFIPQGIPASNRAEDIFEDPEIDTVIELLGDIPQAYTWVKKALWNGKSVVSANKALIAQHGAELSHLAKQNDCDLCFEAAVGGALPLIKNFRRGFVANHIHSLYGILNGTSNFILSKMQKERLSYQAALQLAQAKGYAEADPHSDISGLDAAQKLAILTALGFDLPLLLASIHTRGITGIHWKDLDLADSLGYCVRHLAVAIYNAQKKHLELSVQPTMLPKKHFFTEVHGTQNALFIESSYIGPLLVMGHGAGGAPTASSVISDLVFVAKKRGGESPEHWFYTAETKKTELSINQEIRSAYYLRLSLQDHLNVIPEVSQSLAQSGIAIANVYKTKESDKPESPDMPTEKLKLGEASYFQDSSGRCNIIILTHPSTQKNLEQAIPSIKAQQNPESITFMPIHPDS